MKTLRKSLIVLVASMAAGTATADYASISTYNTYGNRTVWITIYDVGKTTHLDYGCVQPNGNRRWTSGNYLAGSFYYVRGEVKEGKDCGGRTLCDTTIRANPQDHSLGVGRAEGSVLFIKPNWSNCYWEE